MGRETAVGRPAIEQLPARPDVPDVDLWDHRWANRGLAVLTIGRESQSVVEMVTRSDAYKTDKGISVGSSKEAVQSAYGPPTAVAAPFPGWWSGIYDQIGLAVGVNQNNVAWYVSVFRPGTAKQVYKF